MKIDAKDCKILVTPRSFARSDPELRRYLEAEVREVVYNSAGRPLTAEELLELMPGCHGCIAGLDEINRCVIETADSLKVIARYGVGVENVDLGAADEKGIAVTNTPGANSPSVAELTVGLMLSLARRIPTASHATKADEWPRVDGITIGGKKIGLVGFGAIGRCVARLLSGFDCTILAYDPQFDNDVAESLNVHYRSHNRLLREADFVSLHLPATPQTRSMVNEEFLGKMKVNSYLINTSRGELVEEDALLEALQDGLLSGAALDVFSQQPPGKENRLLAHPRVIATPHIGAHTDGAINAMGWTALRDCLAVLGGEEPANRVV